MHSLTKFLSKLEEYFVYQWLYNLLDDSVKLLNQVEIPTESQVNAVNLQTILYFDPLDDNLHNTFVI